MGNQQDQGPAPQPPWARGFGTGYGIVAAGFQLVFSILFFMGMGYLADRKLGTKPWLMLAGLALGLAAGFYTFLRRIRAAANDGRGKTGRDERR